MPEILENLNEPQRQAVIHGEGPLLILAGAGSGKTRVITRRVAYLSLERGVDPRRILAITFTNKAAREMKERVLRWIPRGDLWISTFHAMGARILRMEIEALGYSRDFTIYDTYDRDVLLREILKGFALDTTRFRPAQVGASISGLKNRMVGPEEAAEGGGFLEQVVAKVYRSYQKKMRESNALDFDDLLLLTLELFEKHPQRRARYAERFEHLLIDEYQDTNRVQYLLARHLAGERKNLCACGDPDQSIYKWRGADVQNILDFEKDFGAAKIVKLEQNYRSTKTILSAAESVIRNNRARKAKTLWTENAEGDRVLLLGCTDDEEEAKEIAAQIRALHAHGMPYGEIAIFYRANFQQRALEAGLRSATIPYKVVAGVEFFERKEIKDCLAYLRVLANPRDDLSLERIANVPPRGLGEASFERLKTFAARESMSLLQAVSQAERVSDLGPKAKKSFLALAQMLEIFSRAAEGPAGAALDVVIAQTGYLEHVGDLGDPGDVERVENVEELLRYAKEYDLREPEGWLRGFLQEVSLVADADRMRDEGGGVSLMTLHSAKGLEFPAVFIAGCEEGLLPHARSVDERDGLEEERRLFYVGITRARQRLFLSYARSRMQFGAPTQQGPSRFLREIPESLFEGREEEGEEESGGVGMGESAIDEGPVFHAGEIVRHAMFGEGKVLAMQGRGVNARVQIDFRRFGTKTLLVGYANLERAGAAR